jgi:CO dehydrogenase maturation factor
VALGVPAGVAGALTPVPPALVSRRIGGAGLTEPVEDVLARHSVPGPDRTEPAGPGGPAHADAGCLCSAHAVVSSLLEDLAAPERFVVVDMEASPEHLSRGTVRHVDAVLLVAEPYYRSLETVRRMAELAAELPVPRLAVVANKVRSRQDEAAISEFCARHRLAMAGAVPWSEEVVAADRARVPVAEWPSEPTSSPRCRSWPRHGRPPLLLPSRAHRVVTQGEDAVHGQGIRLPRVERASLAARGTEHNLPHSLGDNRGRIHRDQMAAPDSEQLHRTVRRDDICIRWSRLPRAARHAPIRAAWGGGDDPHGQVAGSRREPGAAHLLDRAAVCLVLLQDAAQVGGGAELGEQRQPPDDATGPPFASGPGTADQSRPRGCRRQQRQDVKRGVDHTVAHGRRLPIQLLGRVDQHDPRGLAGMLGGEEPHHERPGRVPDQDVRGRNVQPLEQLPELSRLHLRAPLAAGGGTTAEAGAVVAQQPPLGRQLLPHSPPQRTGQAETRLEDDHGRRPGAVAHQDRPLLQLNELAAAPTLARFSHVGHCRARGRLRTAAAPTEPTR